MKYNIKIDYKYPKQIGGTIGDYAFTVKWENGKCIKRNNNGIMPYSSEKKVGITYLKITKLDSSIGGNPLLPSKTVKASIYAKFEEGRWHVLNQAYKQIVEDLIEYIERIKSFRIA